MFYDAGFTINGNCGLINSGPEFRVPFGSESEERQEFFTKMCLENTVYLKTGGDCYEDWSDYRDEILKKAQGAYLLTVVWAQIANILIRKTTVASIFDWYRMTSNTFMLWSILSEIVVIVILVYVPGLNTVFLMDGPDPRHAACAVWIIPLLLMWDEGRKWICRKYKNGTIYKMTVF